MSLNTFGPRRLGRIGTFGPEWFRDLGLAQLRLEAYLQARLNEKRERERTRLILLSALRALAARNAISWDFTLAADRIHYLPEVQLDDADEFDLNPEYRRTYSQIGDECVFDIKPKPCFQKSEEELQYEKDRVAFLQVCGELEDSDTAFLFELVVFLVVLLALVIRCYFVECRWRDHPYRPEIVQEGFLILHSFHPPEAETALQGPFAYGCVPVLLAA